MGSGYIYYTFSRLFMSNRWRNLNLHKVEGNGQGRDLFGVCIRFESGTRGIEGLAQSGRQAFFVVLSFPELPTKSERYFLESVGAFPGVRAFYVQVVGTLETGRGKQGEIAGQPSVIAY